MPSGFFDERGVEAPDFGTTGVAPSARLCRKAVDSGRYFSISGTSANAGSAPITNIHRHP
jgi:hypothetical protein